MTYYITTFHIQHSAQLCTADTKILEIKLLIYTVFHCCAGYRHHWQVGRTVFFWYGNNRSLITSLWNDPLPHPSEGNFLWIGKSDVWGITGLADTKCFLKSRYSTRPYCITKSLYLNFQPTAPVLKVQTEVFLVLLKPYIPAIPWKHDDHSCLTW